MRYLVATIVLAGAVSGATALDAETKVPMPGVCQGLLHRVERDPVPPIADRMGAHVNPRVVQQPDALPVLVVVTQPLHWQPAVLLAAKRRVVKKVVRVDERIEAALERRVGVVDVLSVAQEHA